MNCSANMKPKPKRPILKYLALTAAGLILFKVAAEQARLDRGYSAIGGEAVFLLLPVLYYVISKTVRDWLDDLKNKTRKGVYHRD